MQARVALTLALVLAAACATAPAPRETPLARTHGGARSLVLVLDASGEAERPASQAALEAALALSAGSPRDRWAVGALAARDASASILLSLEDEDDAAREGAARALAAVERSGSRALARGVRRALDMLGAGEAARGSLVLLLASRPTDAEAAELEPLEAELARRGFRLERAPVEDGPRAAVARLAEEAFGFAAAEGSPGSVRAGASGGALAWLAVGGKLPAGSAEPTRHAIAGVALDARLWDPAPAAASLESASGTTLVLYRPPWTLAFEPDAPPPLVYLGEPIPLALSAPEGSPPPPATTEVRFAPGGADQGLLARTATPRGPRFDGTAAAPLEEGPHALGLEVRFALGDARFTLARSARFLARKREGPPPPRVRVSPSRLDLGVAWVGTALVARVLVRGDPERPTRVALEPVAGARLPTPLALAPGESRAIEVALEPGRFAPGTRLRLEARVEGPAGARVRPRVRGESSRAREDEALSPAPPWTGVVPVAFEPHEAELASALALPALLPGEESRLETPLRVTPPSALELTARLADARGVAVTAEVEGEKLVLHARADAGAAPGKRAGTLELRLARAQGPAVVRPVSVEVVARPELALTVEPARLTLRGRYGWAEGRVTLAANERARVSLAPGTLDGPGARITPRRDIRVRAADASWDARTLDPGQRRELVFRVYLGSDLPPGRYEGRVAVTLESDRLPSVERAVPIALEVER